MLGSEVDAKYGEVGLTLRVARDPLAVGEASSAPYGIRFAGHDHTQPQLFALLVPRNLLRTDYRGVVALASECVNCARP